MRPEIGCFLLPIAIFLTVITVGANDSPWVALPVIVGMVLYATGMLRGNAVGEVTVGRDGVLIARPGRKRFVSFVDVDAVRSYRAQKDFVCELQLRGATVILRGDTRALYETVEAQWQAYCDASDQAEDLAETEQRLADAEEFREAAKVDYRMAAVDLSELEELVADASAPLALRAAAASALDGRGKNGSDRLRIEADGLVAPGHREALLRIADAEPDERQVLIEEMAAAEEVLLGIRD